MAHSFSTIPSNGGVNRGFLGEFWSALYGVSKVRSDRMIQDQDLNLRFALHANEGLEMERWVEHARPDRQRSAAGNGILPLISFFLMLITLPHSTFALLTSQLQALSPAPRPLLSSRAPNASSLLECLQVSPPVLSPTTSACQQTLMVHTFGWSYGMPFVSEYLPPDCDFNRVTINFTVTSAGRQFDRLALMFLNDTEVFRTSTAEPTQNGIIWTYVKDMSNYLTLFKEPQKIIFDLGNLIDDTYTGSWNTTLTATFFTADDTNAADVIIPISARKSTSDQPSGFVVPDSKAINIITLPQSAKKAVFTISACGQATEEFWWSNVLSSDTQVFGNETTLYGHSPFRELQVYIDGSIAGFAWPYPVIFTGGVVPGSWRPVVGIDAFDLREDEIDISAFLPLLSDGKEHSFEIRVVGIDDDGKGNGNLTDAIGSNWIVTGKIFVWLDSEGNIVKGNTPTITAPEPFLDLHSSVKRGANGSVISLDYSVKVSRRLSIESTIETSDGPKTMTWAQNLTFSNEGQFTNGGNDQITKQSTIGSDVSAENNYSLAFEYPLWVFSTYKVLSGGNYSIDGKMGRGKYIQRVGDLAFPSELKTFDFNRLPAPYRHSFKGTSSHDWQNGTASYLAVPAQKRSIGSGSTEQVYSLSGIDEDAAAIIQDDIHDIAGQGSAELYHRHVLAVNDSVVFDEESFGGQGAQSTQSSFPTQGRGTFAKLGIKAMLGRGPF